MNHTKQNDDVIKWEHFLRYWPFVRGTYRSPVNFPHKGKWRRALIFSLTCAWINAWVNNREAGDLRRHRAHYDAILMQGIGWFVNPEKSLPENLTWRHILQTFGAIQQLVSPIADTWSAQKLAILLVFATGSDLLDFLVFLLNNQCNKIDNICLCLWW